MLNAGQPLLCTKVIKRERTLVLTMMWCMWELIWLIMRDAGLVSVKKDRTREREGGDVEGVTVNKMCTCVCLEFSRIHTVSVTV